MAGSTFNPGAPSPTVGLVPAPAPISVEPASVRKKKGLKMIPTLSIEDYELPMKDVYNALGITLT